MTWVFCGFPVFMWVSGVAGVPTIYATGVQIPSGSVSAVVAAAAAANVPLSIGTPPPGGVIYSPSNYLTETQANQLYEPIGSAGAPTQIDGGNAGAD